MDGWWGERGRERRRVEEKAQDQPTNGINQKKGGFVLSDVILFNANSKSREALIIITSIISSIMLKWIGKYQSTHPLHSRADKGFAARILHPKRTEHSQRE